MKRKNIRLLSAFLYLFLLFATATKAQSNIDTSYADSADDNYMSDSVQTEDGYDTTGYYFNWKEYTDDPFTDRKIEVRIASDSTIQKLRNDDDFWYVKSIEEFKKNAYRIRYDKRYRDSLTREGLLPPDEQVFTQEPDSNAWYLQRWFAITLWTIIIGIFITAVVYFLLSNKINIFSKKMIRSNTQEEALEENLYSANYDDLLAKYSNEKKYRLAVRILYLQLLKMLNEKGIITFQPQFTNTHYLQQLTGSGLYHDFFIVTHHYEYVWYGEFAISEASFQKIIFDFSNLKKRVLS